MVLLGDAAHAMLPHHGQGANQTLEDAAVLADCLAEYGSGEPAVAFAHYERARRARTRQVQRSSWVTSALLHLPDGPAATAQPGETYVQQAIRSVGGRGKIGYVHFRNIVGTPYDFQEVFDLKPVLSYSTERREWKASYIARRQKVKGRKVDG